MIEPPTWNSPSVVSMLLIASPQSTSVRQLLPIQPAPARGSFARSLRSASLRPAILHPEPHPIFSHGTATDHRPMLRRFPRMSLSNLPHGSADRAEENPSRTAGRPIFLRPNLRSAALTLLRPDRPPAGKAPEPTAAAGRLPPISVPSAPPPVPPGRNRTRRGPDRRIRVASDSSWHALCTYRSNCGHYRREVSSFI